MNRVNGKLLLLIAACALLSCEQSELTQVTTEIVQKEANSVLQVRTRTSTTADELNVSYPVNVYVFSGTKCVSLQTIADETQTLNISLTEGSYDVYAIGGATSENYVLPSETEATPAMSVTLREGKSHTDLMATKSHVQLVDGGTNVLTLSMERKVMRLQRVVLQSIPSAATAVSVTLSPLWQNLEGVTYKDDSGTETIALEKQEDGRTWSFTGLRYLLPPSANSATITVNIVKPTGTTSYTYNTSEQFVAGDVINIEGKYTEAIGVTLTGTIIGAKWNEEKTISFDFNEQGTQPSGDNAEKNTPSAPTDYVLVDNIPSAGSTYQGCYVLSVSENEGISEVLLLSSKQKATIYEDKADEATALSAIEAAMPDCAVSGIEGWRLMNGEEIELVRKNRSKISNLNTDAKYLYVNSDGKLRISKLSATQVTEGFSFASTDILRPVAIVNMKKK